MCDACASAEQNHLSGLYQAECQGCKVRAVANGRELFEASKAGKITPEYQDALTKVFHGDWRIAHERVKEYIEKTKGKQC